MTTGFGRVQKTPKNVSNLVKQNGWQGIPCRSPLQVLKLALTSLMLMHILPVWTPDVSNWLRPKAFPLENFYQKIPVHLIISFLKIQLNDKAMLPDDFNSCKTSCRTTTAPSWIVLVPGIKTVWVGLMYLWIILDTLIFKIFVMTLNITLIKQIGLYCLISLAPMIFGKIIITLLLGI
jgi:hypothetical protein